MDRSAACLAGRLGAIAFLLYDMAVKYADVLPVADVLAFMEQYRPAN